MTSKELLQSISDANINDWHDIEEFLTGLAITADAMEEPASEQFDNIVSKGVAFITYDFGIDGVSIEIFKYADCLEKLFARAITPSLSSPGGGRVQTSPAHIGRPAKRGATGKPT